MAKRKVLTMSQLRIARSYSINDEREKNIIGKRIFSERSNQHLTRVELGKLLKQVGIDVVPATIRAWEIGENVPSAYQLLAICAVFGIDDVLLNFDSTFIPPLNEQGQKKVREYADDLAASGKYRVEQPAPQNIVFIDMPVSNLMVSAGTGAFLDEGSFEIVSFPKETVPNSADFGVRVRGDSMEPVYHDGQIVWVQKCNQLHPGEVGVFLYDGEGFLKRYDEQEPDDSIGSHFVDSNGVLHKQPVLISYNKKYEPKVVSPDVVFRIEGRVLN